MGKLTLSAIELGLNHIDCATLYNNENDIGRDGFGPLWRTGKSLKTDVRMKSMKII